MSETELKQFQRLVLENERLEQQLRQDHPNLGSIWLYIGLMWTVYGLIRHLIYLV